MAPKRIDPPAKTATCSPSTATAWERCVGMWPGVSRAVIAREPAVMVSPSRMPCRSKLTGSLALTT